MKLKKSVNPVHQKEIQLDLIPQKRPVGRPKTGFALSPAEKQRRYREKLSRQKVLVMFDRSDVADLKLLLSSFSSSELVSNDVIERLCSAVFDADLAQRL